MTGATLDPRERSSLGTGVAAEAHSASALSSSVLMCRPAHFTVVYRINPWMHPEDPTDTALAVRQWETLYRTYLDLGLQVELIDGLAGSPDMVYAANGGFTMDGIAYTTRFAHPERAAEAPAYDARLDELGFRVVRAKEINEGEGDLLPVGGAILAGHGFRTSLAAHAELAELTDREVVSLRLVNPSYYHLDTALAVIDRDRELVAYLPSAFDAESLATLQRRYPDAIIATEEDAAVFGMNAYAVGSTVVIAAQATTFPDQLRERGYDPVGVDLSELLLGGGGVKCCTLELRAEVRS